MSVYLRILASDWYVKDICDYAFNSLEGAKGWTSHSFESSIEREAYIETFEQCQKIAKSHDMEPKEMVEALFVFGQNLESHYSKPPLFSRARLLYKPMQARARAVEVAGELVEGIFLRFLAHG